MIAAPPHTVLHVRVVTGAGGGPDKTILRSPRYLRDAGYDELCAYLRSPCDAGFAALEAQAVEADAELIAVDDNGPLDVRVVQRMLAVCRERNVSIWHGHDYKSNALGVLLARFWPMRLVTTVHGWVHHTGRTPLYYFVDRLALRRYERVLCVSRDLLAQCVASGVARDRCLLLENGIEVERFTRRQDQTAARDELGLSLSTPLIGAIGRLAKEKGFDHLLRAVADLHAQGQPVRAVIMGEGPERAALERLRDELGLQAAVSFPGHVADVRPWLEACDLFVLSSLREAMPNVVLEAMALATPVIATRIAGVPDMIVDGTDGLIVEPGQASAIAAAAGQLLRNSQFRQRLAASARETVTRRFDFADRMQKMREIYDALLDAKSTSAAAEAARH
jgi:glycosyltransferase involved in cell wall biosynthesis